MSSTKEWWFEQIEARRNKRLADLLGITDDELEQISYEIDVDQSSDGLGYGYIVRFDNDNDPAIMSKIVGLISGSYVSFSPWDIDDPEEDELEWEVKNSEQLKTLNKHLSKVPQLLQIDVDANIQFSLLVMMHVYIVSALEQFLSATFIHNVTNSDVLTRKLIETDPEFGCRKFTINEIYAQYSNIKLTVAAYLKDINFHDMRKVKPMYANVLGYDFGDIAWLFKAVRLRHDCAHRAGYDKEGNKVSVSVESLNELVKQCQYLSENIDAHVQKINNQ